jgi:hypothetical protein
MKKSAFTIVELLLYIGLFSILITVLGSIFINLVDLQLQSHATSNVSQTMDYIFTRLNYDIYRASVVTTPASAGQVSNSLDLSINGQSYTYSQFGTNLILTTPSGSFTLNSSDVNVSAFAVTRLGSATKPNIHIGLTVTSLIISPGKSAETVSFSSSYTLR